MPDDEFRHELVGGHLVSEPPTGARHGRVAARFVCTLDAFASQNDGVVLTSETGYILHRSPDTVRAPDVSLITRKRYLALEDETKAIPGPPDLAVEVLSPGNTRAAIHAKVADYLSAGTPAVWVADPDRQTVRVYHALFAPQTVAGTEMLTGRGPLSGFSVPVCDLFAL